MRPEEARTLAQWIGQIGLPKGSVCLNIGSSTGHFRTVEQPHIAELLIEPLERSGIRFVHCDMKKAPGVDEVGDILDAKVRARLKRHRARLLICSNLFEHLKDPNDFAEACGDLVAEGGYGVFTVPSSYPYHPDPIDTMLRPSPAELAAMLPGWAVVQSCELKTGTYWDDLRKAPKPLVRLARHAARVAMPFYRPSTWRTNASRLLWLLRPYRFSLVLLQKPGATPRPTGRARTRAQAAR
jgi:hypothetical protein